MKTQVVLRPIKKEEFKGISKAFALQGWNKPESQFQKYYQLQQSGEREIIIAETEGEFAGYLTIKWESDYLPFRTRKIPEIVDFNVLKKFQRRGIGTRLMDEAERRIKRVSEFSGIGFGVYKDYGAAQILYAKRNYIPDGNGIIINSVPVKYGENITINDDVALYLIKELS